MYKRCCANCRYLNLLSDNPCSKNSDSFEKIDFSNIEEENRILNKEKDCKEYKCCYIEYPIEINAIVNDSNPSTICDNNSGRPVRIRVASDPEEKTYLGFYIGRATVDITSSYNEDSKDLNIGFLHNPAIFVPELKKVVYGFESWWEFIEEDSVIEDITDETIENVWYVKQLNDMFKG